MLRSALHERFVRFLGHPPMLYLARWRIQPGARLLRESNRTVAVIALDAGYDSEAAFPTFIPLTIGSRSVALSRALLHRIRLQGGFTAVGNRIIGYAFSGANGQPRYLMALRYFAEPIAPSIRHELQNKIYVIDN